MEGAEMDKKERLFPPFWPKQCCLSTHFLRFSGDFDRKTPMFGEKT